MLKELQGYDVEMVTSKAIGYLYSEDKRSLVGVKTQEGNVIVDVVIDTTGRSTQASKWLEQGQLRKLGWRSHYATQLRWGDLEIPLRHSQLMFK